MERIKSNLARWYSAHKEVCSEENNKFRRLKVGVGFLLSNDAC